VTKRKNNYRARFIDRPEYCLFFLFLNNIDDAETDFTDKSRLNHKLAICVYIFPNGLQIYAELLNMTSRYVRDITSLHIVR